jgi:hypothetical protein
MKIKSVIFIGIGIALFVISCFSQSSGGSNGQEAITNLISHLGFSCIILGGCRMIIEANEEKK